MAASPIASEQTDGEIMEIVTDLIFGGSKITADGDCSHEFKSGMHDLLKPAFQNPIRPSA